MHYEIQITNLMKKASGHFKSLKLLCLFLEILMTKFHLAAVVNIFMTFLLFYKSKVGVQL